MSGRSNIEWTETTWNPTTGCTKISSGCKNCYAQNWAHMQQKRGISQYKSGFELALAPNRLEDPIKWKKPKMVFVNSMSDVFHKAIPSNYLESIFEVMNNTPWHTYQILTKRIERILETNSKMLWSENIWLGVSVEDKTTIQRIELLKSSSAKVKFISFEPLLESLGSLDLNGIDWVIVGGESGGSARKLEKEWVLEIMSQCKNKNIPFFFKQWGKRIFNPDPTDPTMDRPHPHYARGGCMIDKEIIREFPKKTYGLTN